MVGEGRNREGKGKRGSGRGRGDRERGGKTRLGYLSRGPEFLVTPLICVPIYTKSAASLPLPKQHRVDINSRYASDCNVVGPGIVCC